MKACDVEQYRKIFEKSSAEESLSKAAGLFPAGRIALASSLSAEDQVLTAMAADLGLGLAIFTIDTGRLPQETYGLMQATMEKYGFKYEILFPEYRAVERMTSEHGPNLFYAGYENRLLCCGIRKVEPLKRKLALLDGWICGLRREQSITRTSLEKIEWDETNGLVKINPLAEWPREKIWEYIRSRGVPYNALYDRGYASIGCAPCTRAIRPGEDERAGRWWWETPEHKECGLHYRRKD